MELIHFPMYGITYVLSQRLVTVLHYGRKHASKQSKSFEFKEKYVTWFEWHEKKEYIFIRTRSNEYIFV